MFVTHNFYDKDGKLVKSVEEEVIEYELTPSQMREEAYNTEKIISWDGDLITVTEASQKWQYYAAEGSEKANALQSLIAEAKAEIRAKYPDKEVI